MKLEVAHALGFRKYGAAWFRIGGYGLSWADHRKAHELFSERNRGQYGIPKKWRLHVGPYCIMLLSPGKP